MCCFCTLVTASGGGFVIVDCFGVSVITMVYVYYFQSPVYTRTPTMYLDMLIKKGGSITQKISSRWTAFAYVLSGEAYFGK